MSGPPAGVTRHYPDAVPLEVFLKEQSTWLRGHGFDPAAALAVTASCRDEVVAALRAGVRHLWDNAFDFSSLSGLPLAGITGAQAVLAHAPVAAARPEIVIFALPHIGVLADGTPGQCLRRGRPEPTTACGSLTAAVAWADTFRGDPDAAHQPVDMQDPEQSLVRTHLLRHVPQLADLDPVAVVAEVAALQREDLWRLVERTTEPEDADVALVSGILVHGPDDEDFVSPQPVRTRTRGVVTDSAGAYPA